MKARFLAALLLTVLMPFTVSADVSTDMDNPQLSLMAVMQNALASGMSVAEAVSAMIAEEPAQSGAIVATAMIVEPGEFRAIIGAAISGGAEAGGVVTAALVATNGKDSDDIIAAGIDAAPGQVDAIIAASDRVLAQLGTAGGSTLQATSSALAPTTVATSSGGGAVTTTDQVLVLLEIIASGSGGGAL